MIVQFMGRGVNVEYGWGELPLPRVGEHISFDGSDQQAEASVLIVRKVDWLVSLRGPQKVRVTVG